MFFWEFSTILRLLKVASSQLKRNVVDQNESLKLKPYILDTMVYGIRKLYKMKIPPTKLFLIPYHLTKYLLKVNCEVIRAMFIEIIYLYCWL